MIGLVVRRFFVRPNDFAFPPNVPMQPEARAGILRDSAIVASSFFFMSAAGLCSRQPNWLGMAATLSIR